jgi:hypothetical protein
MLKNKLIAFLIIKKKIGIVLLLLMCVTGFTMSSVNALEYKYYINGKVGDVFEVDRYNCYYDMDDAVFAFDKSNQFNKTPVTKFAIGTNDFYKGYIYTAIYPGVSTVKTDRSSWISPNYYYFNIK